MVMPASFLQLPRHDLLRRAGADRGIGDVAGMRFRIGDKDVEIVGRNRVRQRQPIIIFGDQRNRREIGELETDIAIHRDIDRIEMRAEQQRIAVRGLGEEVARRHDPGRRRLVFDNDRLAERVAQLVGDKARRNIGRPAGAEADQKPDGPFRIGVVGHRATTRCRGTTRTASATTQSATIIWRRNAKQHSKTFTRVSPDRADATALSDSRGIRH